MTAPDMALVEVIAQAMTDSDFAEMNTCGDPEYYDRQARAVLDAISEAGAVDVVTGYGVKLKSGDVERQGTNINAAKDWLVSMTGGDDPDYEPMKVVTRTTATITIRTDWTAVEG